MNKRYSLYKIEEKENHPFKPQDYSKFKFGDKFYAKKFAKELFKGFVAEYGDILLSNEDSIVILPSPYLSIPTASNFLCYYFKKHLNKFLFENNKKVAIESKIYRNQTYVADYGNLDFEERIQMISNDTYYIDRNFISGKLCIFVDDIKITGSHEYTVKKVLDTYDVDGDFVFVYLAELMNKDIHPNIENYYNYAAIKDIHDIIDVLDSHDFQFNTRIVKYILKLDKEQFDFFLSKISSQRANELFELAISNNYHKIVEYENNINLIHQN
ncbi:phosphoribosyltransferase family protein [Aquimarina longa]|uniref:phosphoribosyltransferase family protein n=1 Tax=Aquimarina longa TaxID=1080221 RepID=UPI0007815A84|nr:phosphoribosyltransferase family protein [Aquimarina longa]